MFCWSGAGKLYGLNQSAAELQLTNQAQQGAVRRMRTRIRFLAQPEPMRSIVGATQKERRHGSA